MSWRKIEKVWDEVRSAQEPKQNLSKKSKLSKQPKKVRETKLSAKDELHDIVSMAFGSEQYLREYAEFVNIVDNFLSAAQSLSGDLIENMPPDWWEENIKSADEYYKKISDLTDDLGVSVGDVMEDYDDAAIKEALSILPKLRDGAQSMYDSIEDIKSYLRNFS